jgi:hypothetical protein
MDAARIGAGWIVGCIIGGLGVIAAGVVSTDLVPWFRDLLVFGGLVAIMIGAGGVAMDIRAAWFRRHRLPGRADALRLESASIVANHTEQIVPMTAHDLVPFDPIYVHGLFRSTMTTAAVAQLVSGYLGKWVSISGPVHDVNDLSGHGPGLGFLVSIRPISGDTPLVSMYFDRQWRRQVLFLNKDEVITVIGKVASIDGIGSHLDKCELAVSPQSTPRTPKAPNQ